MKNSADFWWNFWSDFLQEKSCVSNILMDLPPSGLLVKVLKQFSKRKKWCVNFLLDFLPSGLLVKLLKRFSTRKKQCVNFLMDLPSRHLVPSNWQIYRQNWSSKGGTQRKTWLIFREVPNIYIFSEVSSNEQWIWYLFLKFVCLFSFLGYLIFELI